jgi:hypothetical protein
MLDENRWLAARHGLEGELVDLPSSDRVATKVLARRLIDRLREHAQDLGSAGELAGIEDLLARGNGAARQVIVYEANQDFREVMAAIVAATAGDPDSIEAPGRQRASERSPTGATRLPSRTRIDQRWPGRPTCSSFARNAGRK